jgi:hypothetical protein
METPPLVEERLEGESIRTRVDLGGNDAAFVTPTRTLLYRSEGLRSDETVQEYDHRVDRVELDTGRRKATVRLIGIEGTESFSVGSSRIGDVIEPLLAGVLVQSGVIEEMEAVEAVYRFSELTLVVTDARVLKHVGSALWDDDHESFPFANVTGLETEEGSHATGLVLEVDGRPQRVKIPAEEARVVARAVENALLSYHGVSSLSELRVDDDEEDDDPGDTAAGFDDPNIPSLVDDDGDRDGGGAGAGASAGEPPGDEAPTEEPTSLLDDPRSAEAGDAAPRPGERSRSHGTDAGGDASADPALHDRVDDLEAKLDRQAELLERQGDLIEQLVDELRRGR